MAIPWAEQYRHPLWQKKRLEALEDAGFECTNCGTKDTQLHVHHKRYVKGRLIWEYELAELEVLCEPCHEEAHYIKGVVADVFLKVPWASHVELIQIVKGYVNTTQGPEFDASFPRHEDQYMYYIGVMAAAFERLGNEQAEMARSIAAGLRKSAPRATELHSEIEDVASWLDRMMEGRAQ